MPADADINRKAPTSIKEYAAELGETIKVAKWVWKEFQTPESRKWFRIYIVFVVIMMLFSVAQPYAVRYIFDAIVKHDVALIIKSLGAFLICIIGAVLSMLVQARAREWMLSLHLQRWDHRITELMFEKSIGQHIQHASELGVSNIDKGRWKAHDLESLIMFDGLSTVLGLVLAYVFLWVLSPVAGSLMTVMIIMHLVWTLYLNQRVVSVCTPIEKDFRRVNRHRVERWEKIERVKVNGKESEELTVLAQDLKDVMDRDRTFYLWFIGQTSMRGLITNLFMFAVMVYGAWRVWRGEWTMGLLYPLFAWSQRLAENMWRVSQIEHMFNWNMPSVKSLIEALTIKPDVVDAPDAMDLNGSREFRIELADVAHTYPGQNCEDGNGPKKDPRPVLKNISFTIEPGEKVALIGLSGSGKTTIMRMLLRYMDPQCGAIRINGRDLRNLKLSSWLKNVGYIAQQPQILDNTLRYNLLYALPAEARAKLSDEQIWAHMRQYCIDFEDRLTHGLETKVGKNGIQLSGGEAQRLMIGAAMIKNPRFLVIDEATSSLDSLTEWEVQKGLEIALQGDQSALVIAHRLSTVRRICHKFIVMKPANKLQNGEPQIEAAAGSFEELYKRSPTFRALADRQELNI